MLEARRPPSKSFCGTAPSIDRLKDERVGTIRRQCEQGLVPYAARSIDSTHPQPAPYGLRRTISMPDCNEMRVLHNAKIIIKPISDLKRIRSVSFEPEVLLASAVAENDLTEAQSLIDKYKLNIDHQSASGLTALHYAALEGSFECLELLVNKGARIDILDSKGCSPLDFAVRGGNFDCAAYLIKAGAEIKRIVNGLR
ncbi:protein phosphatase 1 regulatory subunit 27 [Nematostella vectensis]|nr:protein phosphatase 1 regulatory subunit 27 [Nematostella vectensis]